MATTIAITANELITTDPKTFTNAKNGKLYNGDGIVADGDTITDLFVNVLNHISTILTPDEITTILKGICNNSGKKIRTNDSIMKKIDGTDIYVDVHSNTLTKFSKIKTCFKMLQEKGVDITVYKFEIEKEETNSANPKDKNSNEEKNTMNKSINELVKNAIENNKQVIFTGAPGTGKTYSVLEYVKENCEDETQYKFVQFHPSYDYSDFVEGLRPVVLNGKDETTFVRLDGVFKAFCRKIAEDTNKEKKYYFIVDEINRADLAKVFGELMFGLEESYRGKKFDTQYKNLVTYKIDNGKAVQIENDVFKDGFYIPENLYFIGTMNDIDRSVDSMDFALRRRFQWVDIRANEIMKTSLHSIFKSQNASGTFNDKIDELAAKVIAMNEVISTGNKFGLSEAYHIGPAYFKKLDLNNFDASLKNIFDTNITSILREYTRGRKSDEVTPWIDKCRSALLGEK